METYKPDIKIDGIPLSGECCDLVVQFDPASHKLMIWPAPFSADNNPVEPGEYLAWVYPPDGGEPYWHHEYFTGKVWQTTCRVEFWMYDPPNPMPPKPE